MNRSTVSQHFANVRLTVFAFCGVTVLWLSPWMHLNESRLSANPAIFFTFQDDNPPQVTTTEKTQQEPEGLKEDEPVTADTERWLQFKPEGAFVEIKMPRKPRLTERIMTPIEGQPPIKIKNYVLNFNDNKGIFILTYHDLHEAPVETAVDDTLKEAMLGSVLNVRGRLLSQNRIRYGTHPGYSFEFRLANNNVFFKGVGRVFLVGKRQYQIAAILEEENYDQKLATAYLDSFTIIEPEPDSTSESETDMSANKDGEQDSANPAKDGDLTTEID
jgi:hypothetical protein